MNALFLDRSAESRPMMLHSDTGLHPARPPEPRRRLLLVDDNAEGRRALAQLLQFYHFEVIAAADGAAALHHLRTGPVPDVVLTDLILPDVDGREVAREAHGLQPTPLVVLITGWDFGAEPPDATRWGIDHIFLKPLNVSALLEILKHGSKSPS